MSSEPTMPFLASETTIWKPLPQGFRATISADDVAAWDLSRSLAVNMLRLQHGATQSAEDQDAIMENDQATGRHWVGFLGLTLSLLGSPGLRESVPLLRLTESDDQAVESPLLALRQYVRHIFDCGSDAATEMYIRIEEAVRKGTIVVDRLEVPSELPAGFWGQSLTWKSEHRIATLILVLASPKERMLEEFASRNAFLGNVSLDITTARNTKSASLREAYDEAKEAAVKEGKTTVLRVELVDLASAQAQDLNIGPGNTQPSFARSFILATGPEGAVIWQAGGLLGDNTLAEYCKLEQDKVMSDSEANRFVTDFEKLAVYEVIIPASLSVQSNLAHNLGHLEPRNLQVLQEMFWYRSQRDF